MDNSSLAHTKWNRKYHIVFAPKYRRQIIYGKIKTDIGMILRKLCERKGVEIIEANACLDHIHMLVSIPPKLSVSQYLSTLFAPTVFRRRLESRLWCFPSKTVIGDIRRNHHLMNQNGKKKRSDEKNDLAELSVRPFK